MVASLIEIKNDTLITKQIKYVNITPNIPDRKTHESILPLLPHLKAIVKEANPKAEINAEIFPPILLLELSPETIKKMPKIANIKAIQVINFTLSLKKIHPKKAVINGAVANRSIA